MCDAKIIDDALSELTRIVSDLSDKNLVNNITHQLKVIKRSTDNLRLEVYEDSKFDVLNSKSYDKALSEKLEGRESFYLGIVDLDSLKSINENYGHFLADKVIMKVISILQTEFGKQNVFRIGGDEFVILMDNRCNLNKFDSARLAVSKMTVRDRRRKEPVVGGFSISTGVALYTSESSNAGHVEQLADEMLYKAKLSRNSVVYAPF